MCADDVMMKLQIEKEKKKDNKKEKRLCDGCAIVSLLVNSSSPPQQSQLVSCLVFGLINSCSISILLLCSSHYLRQVFRLSWATMEGSLET